MKINIDTAERSPLYRGSMCLDDVKPGVQYITYNRQLRFFHPSLANIATFLSKPHAVDMPFIGMSHMAGSTESGYLRRQADHHVHLTDMGITPYNWGNGRWNEANFTVEVNEASIVAFYDWLLNTQRDEKSAQQLKDAFVEFFEPIVPEEIVVTFTLDGLSDKSEVQIENVGGKLTLIVTDRL